MQRPLFRARCGSSVAAQVPDEAELLEHRQRVGLLPVVRVICAEVVVDPIEVVAVEDLGEDWRTSASVSLAAGLTGNVRQSAG